jgi:Hemerythrin HHE cation binding domain
MCDSCGCRDQPIIAELGAEHEHVLALADRAVRALRAGYPDEARSDALAIVAVLGEHTRKEEAGLFAELSAAGFAPDVEVLLGDHHLIEALGAVASSPGLEGLDVALFRLEDHIFREEQDVFPAAVTLLDGAAWGRADAAHRAIASEADAARVLGVDGVGAGEVPARVAGSSSAQGAH